jgi:hypothetical protein
MASRRYRSAIRALSVLASLVLTSAAEARYVSWREEVKLSTGQTVVAELGWDYRTKEEALTAGALLSTFRIIVLIPSPMQRRVSWEGSLKPLAIDVGTDGKIYLVAIAIDRNGVRQNSPPDGLHVAFVYSGANAWQRIPLESVPLEMRPNLLISVGEIIDKPGFANDVLVDLPLKAKLDANPRIDESYRGWSNAPR